MRFAEEKVVPLVLSFIKELAEYEKIHNFSTFLGQPGLYLEDLYIKPEMRGKGLGKIMLSFLAKLAAERKCGRLEWNCLDWNEPSIKFYKRLGAVLMDEWTVYRVNDKTLTDLAKSFDD